MMSETSKHLMISDSSVITALMLSEIKTEENFEIRHSECSSNNF